MILKAPRGPEQLCSSRVVATLNENRIPKSSKDYSSTKCLEICLLSWMALCAVCGWDGCVVLFWQCCGRGAGSLLETWHISDVI